jgi:hypothetical protein
MRALMAFFKKMQLSKIAIACLLGIVLLTTTACNNGNELGARPQNPPVQMGGQNNPHKAGGDGYSHYKSSLDPAVNPAGEQSMLPSSLIMASTGIDLADSGGVLLYPAEGKVESADSRNDFVSPQRQKELLDPGQIPAVKQPVIDRSDPDAKILEKVGQTFKDASSFILDADETREDQAARR